MPSAFRPAPQPMSSSPRCRLPTRPRGGFGAWRLAGAREVIVHVLTETACPAGTLVAVRESIDGRQWLVLTA